MAKNQKLTVPVETLIQKPKFFRNKHDYCIYDTNANVGLCEIQGRRLEQQDQLTYDASAISSELLSKSQADQAEILTETFKQLSKNLKHQQHGSTLCSATAVRKNDQLHIAVGNVGDSAAYVVIINEDNSLAKIEQMNTLHSPHDVEEQIRIEKAKGIIKSGRLGGTLAMTRSMGDNTLEKVGLSHAPEIVLYQTSIMPTQKAFLVVGCDGLVESDRSLSDVVSHLGARVAAHSQDKLHEITKALVEQAFVENKSTDNISVALSEIDETPKTLVVCDGHGKDGDITARYLANSFFFMLMQACQNQSHEMTVMKLFYTSLMHQSYDEKQDDKIKIDTHYASAIHKFPAMMQQKIVEDEKLTDQAELLVHSLIDQNYHRLLGYLKNSKSKFSSSEEKLVDALIEFMPAFEKNMRGDHLRWFLERMLIVLDNIAELNAYDASRRFFPKKNRYFTSLIKNFKLKFKRLSKDLNILYPHKVTEKMTASSKNNKT